jgi:hypothetical protein
MAVPTQARVAHHAQRRGRRVVSFAVTLVALACLAGFLLAAYATATPAVETPTPLGFNHAYHKGDDWSHLKLVLATLRVSPPKVPVVYLFGGSAAREATVSDRSWTDQLTRLAGAKTRAFNLGTAGQSYDEDLAVVEKLPPVPGIVLIGVNLGRYTQPPLADPGSPAWLPGGDPDPVNPAALFDYVQHRFASFDVGTQAKKQEILQTWLAERYPAFKRRFVYNARLLDKLIIACQRRGLYPVLVNLPINRPFVGHALDVPCRRFGATSRVARDKFGIPSWDFVGQVGLVNEDYVDLWHLVHSGSVKYQLGLSRRTAVLLHDYGLTDD